MFVYCRKVVHVKSRDRFLFSILFEQTIQRIERQKIDASAVYRHISLSGEMNLRLSKTLFAKLPPKNQLSLYLFGSFFSIHSRVARNALLIFLLSVSLTSWCWQKCPLFFVHLIKLCWKFHRQNNRSKWRLQQ